MPMVLKEYPNIKLVILGKGEEQTDIVETADRLGIKDKVVYRFDFVNEDERILHYAAADVCVFPKLRVGGRAQRLSRTLGIVDAVVDNLGDNLLVRDGGMVRHLFV